MVSKSSYCRVSFCVALTDHSYEIVEVIDSRSEAGHYRYRHNVVVAGLSNNRRRQTSLVTEQFVVVGVESFKCLEAVRRNLGERLPKIVVGHSARLLRPAVGVVLMRKLGFRIELQLPYDVVAVVVERFVVADEVVVDRTRPTEVGLRRPVDVHPVGLRRAGHRRIEQELHVFGEGDVVTAPQRFGGGVGAAKPANDVPPVTSHVVLLMPELVTECRQRPIERVSNEHELVIAIERSAAHEKEKID